MRARHALVGLVTALQAMAVSAQSVNVFVQPASQSAVAGGSASVEVHLNANGRSVGAGGVFLQFDRTRLSFTGGTVDASIWNNGLFTTAPTEAQPGIVSFSVGAGAAVTSSDARVATLTFAVNAQGLAPLTLLRIAGSAETVFYDTNFSPLSTTVTSGLILADVAPATQTATASHTGTATTTPTPTGTATETASSTGTPSNTPTRTATHTPTQTATATMTPTVTPTSTPTDTPSATPTLAAGCPSVPEMGCRSAGKSLLLLRGSTDDGKDGLLWKWINGPATTQVELGDPTAGAVYRLCAYTAHGWLLGAAIRPSAVMWSPLSDKGYKYTDTGGSSSGVTKVLLKGSVSAGRSKALVKGKGSNLPDPVLGGLQPPVTVQLRNGQTGLCLEGVYGAANIGRNDAGQFKAKAP